MSEELEHSPLGASSAERWMNCPGSNALLSSLQLPPSEEKDFQVTGTAAHEAAAHCLREYEDAWEIVGHEYSGVVMTDEYATAIQVYLDCVRNEWAPGSEIYIETRIGKALDGTRPHPKFYGTVDFGVYTPEFLSVTDLKFGEGVVVEPENNPQIMYYAYGIILRRPEVSSNLEVRLRIVQPRAFHPDGPVREWITTAGEIINWAETSLIPAMEAAEIDNSFQPGKWCRFCPAKLICPALSGMFQAAVLTGGKVPAKLNAETLGLEYIQIEVVKKYIQALEAEVLRRNMLGDTVPGTKLVHKMANRVFKTGAEMTIIEALGRQALFDVSSLSDEEILAYGPEARRLVDAYGRENVYAIQSDEHIVVLPGAIRELVDDFVVVLGTRLVNNPPTFKSPPDIEKISQAAKELVKEWAYKPDTGMTIAPESDRRPAVKVAKPAELFANVEGVKND